MRILIGAGEWKQRLRRYRAGLLPDAHTRAYRSWICQRVAARQASNSTEIPPRLLSIISAVWDGSPPEFLHLLYRSISRQNTNGACEWVLVDNGCSRAPLRQQLEEIGREAWVRVVRHDHNVGIVRGLRSGLETATGEYVLPIDADDELYPDALAIVARAIEGGGHPALLYSDEDKVDGGRASQPYFKPDWDPVLLANSAYTAHLGVVRREEALQLDIYSDPTTEGSVDWDAFLRFASRGYRAEHIREVLYQWRIHAASTAENDAVKEYVGTSQRAALKGFLARHPAGEWFTVEPSPLFSGGTHFRFKRRDANGAPIAVVQLNGMPSNRPAARYPELQWLPLPADAPLNALQQIVAHSTSQFICLMDESVAPDEETWPWEATGIFELFPDAAMAGGCLRSRDGRVLQADQHFGFADGCGSPNRGRKANDPGYFGQMWKQRSVSALASQWLFVRSDCLRRWLLELGDDATIPLLGPRLGAKAAREGLRVVYSPYLTGVVDRDWNALTTEAERAAFRRQFSDLIPDRRFYPEPFSLTHGFVIE